MSFSRRLRAALLWCPAVGLAVSLQAEPFTAGNLVVYRVGAGTSSLLSSGSPVFLDEYTPAGTLVQSIAMPTTVDGSQKRLVASGTATSDGLLSRSANGRYVVLTGYDAAIPHTGSVASAASATVNRVIGRVDGAGAIDTSTALTDANSGDNFRGVCSLDGTQFWTAGAASGLRYTAALGNTTSVQLNATNQNLRQPLIFGGQLYIGAGNGNVRLGAVGAGLPTTAGQTFQSLPGYPTGNPASTNAFFLADLDVAVSGLDTAYVADDGAGLLKYSFNGTTWTARGTAGTGADAYRGLTGSAKGTTVTLYATRMGGGTATGGGELISFVDATGPTGTLTGSPTLLVTARSNTAFRGVTSAPQTDLSLSLAAPAAAFTTAPFDYTITASNNGLANAANVTVQFTLPPGVSYMSASGSGFTASESGGVVTLSGGSIAGGASVDLAVTVAAAVAGTISTPEGAALIDPMDALDETNETNNSSAAAGNTVITDAPDLEVAVSAPATALTGENFDYTIAVINDGLVGANGVSAQFTLPAGLNYVTATGGGFDVQESGGVVSFTGGTLGIGAQAVLKVTVNTSLDGAYTAAAGAAVVDAGNEIVESHEANNSSTAVASTVITTSDLTIAKVHNGTFQAGDPAATYTITVTNIGTGPGKGLVTVTDVMPVGLTAVSLVGEGWNIVQGAGDSVSATRSDVLAAAASYPALTLTVAVALDVTPSLSNTAGVSGGSELNTANSSSTDLANVLEAGAGVIAFAPPPNGVSYEVNEENGTITVPLLRTGGRTGAVSVRVSTADGTAAGGQDFAALTNQEILFANGEVTGSVTANVITGTPNELNETFSLVLSSPAGGAALGANSSVPVLILEPDQTAPSLTLRVPAANARVPEGTVTVAGRAQDAKGLRRVEVSLNGGAFVAATILPPSTSTADTYSLDVPAQPGANTVTVQVLDFRGNVTKVTRSFTYVVKRPLALSITPDATYGTVALTPKEPLAELELGKTYTIKATPAKDKVWNGWTAPALSLSPAQAAAASLTFTMTSGLTLSAAFADDPFVPGVVGSFNGLVQATGAVTPSHFTDGFITLKITATGSFTGTLKIGGLSLPFSGLFDNAGAARFGLARSSSLALVRPGLADLVMNLALDLNPAGSHKVTGSLGEASPAGVVPMSLIEADRAAFDGKTPATSVAPEFHTFAIPAKPQANGLMATDYPQGDGVGSITLAKTGLVSFAGILADGTAISATVPLSSARTAPVFVPLYKEAGSFSGWIAFDSTQPNTDVTGAELHWFKPYSGGHHYPFGWPEGLTLSLIGSKYAVPAGDSVVPDLSPAEGANAALTFSQAGLTSPVGREVSISPRNLVTRVPVSDTSFTLDLTPSSGRISGKFTHTDGSQPAYEGVILQKGENRRAFGHFLTPTPKVASGSGQSGAVSLRTKFNPRPTLVISEFMAKNEATLMDDDGDPSDWIEIYNPGSEEVNLLDWCLTDSAANLTKWRFPELTLGPKQFLLVWASNKNRTNPSAPLHTNFALSNDGEYLALVRPDGVTIEHEFAPMFPALADDESYGINFNGLSFLSAGASARYWVPANGSLGATWVTPDFKDTAWTGGKTGIGFGMNVPGFTVRQVAARPAFGGIYSIATAEALLALPKGHANILSEKTVIAPELNFIGDGADGHYDNNQPPPNGINEPYALKATGIIQVPTAGSYVFGLNSDDGGQIKIDGVAVMTDDSNHGAMDNLGAPVNLTAGSHTVEVLMWEGGGGDELEFFAAPGNASAWDESFTLVGSEAGLSVSTPPLTASTSSNAVATNVQSKMQGLRGSCYVRIPFTATGVSTLSGLSLRMRYNDGFVAYINGTEIARRNAPGTAAFDSLATATRSPTEALTAEVIDITEAIPLLNSGANVLAIHGLNDAVNDSSFLVLPELAAVAGLTGNTVFFSPSDAGPTATPGALNQAPLYLGRVGDPQFSVKHGFFTNPISVAITSATKDAQMRYTLDGSTPTASHGSLYSGPLSISKTTILRIAAFRSGYEASSVMTQSYFFLDDVIRQSATGARPAPGWPSGSINGQVADYGMDPQIVNHANPEIGGVTKVKEALAAIPTISLVTDLPHLFDPDTGIWVNPGARGFTWERPCSMELIGDGNSAEGGFHVNCGMRVRGGFSRSGDNPKHGFHLYFRSAYGPGKLRYPLFGAEGTDEYDQIDLRTAQNYSWSFQGDGSNTFIREESTRELQGAMGQPYGRGRYYHLYINGQYWGLFGSEERTEADYAETYFGGSADDYDVVKAEQDSGYITGVTDGNLDAWQALWTKSRLHAADPSNANYFAMQGLAADGVTASADPVLLDVDNLIDYMLLTFWTGNLDGATSAFLGEVRANNWFGIRHRTGTRGFRFFAHDFEHTYFNVDEDRTGPFNVDTVADFSYSNPMFLHHDLRPNAEYRMRWADRVHKHLFNNGALVAESVQGRMRARAGLVNKVIIAESARWGDSKVPNPYTRLNWQDAVDYVIESYVPQRGSRVLQQLRTDGLYPSIDAPTLSQFGGPIASGEEVIITGTAGTLYYTLDGGDPRLLGGGVNPAAQVYTSSTAIDTVLPLDATWKFLDDGSDQGTAWRGAAFDDSTWNSGPAELGYGDGGEATVVGYVDAEPASPGEQKNATTYFRTSIQLANVSDITAAALKLRYDDGAVIYINGVEAARTGNLPANPAFNQYASFGKEDANDLTDFAIDPALFVEGANIIAAEVHQVDSGSSDISFAASLMTTRTDTPSPLLLTDTGIRRLKVRAREGDEWSALVDAEFDVRLTPDLSLTNLHNGPFQTGGSGSYTLTVSNNGTAATSGAVTVSATLPAGLTATSFAGTGWMVLQSIGQTVIATRSTPLAPGASYPPLVLAVNIASGAPSTVTNVATVSGGGDLSLANNTASETAAVAGVGASQLTLSAADYGVVEDGNSVRITVLRTGNRSGAASVQLSTTDISAKAPGDYEARSGVAVDFTDGEASRDVFIAINNDGGGEVNETFQVTLSNATGLASLGSQTIATVHILEADNAVPTVALTAPTAGARIISGTAVIKGTAKDNKGIAKVQFSLNGGPFVDALTTISAAGTTATYTATVNALNGANTVTVRSIDDWGLISEPVTGAFTFAALRPLTLTMAPGPSAGTVAITPAKPLSALQVGGTYTLKATPKAGFMFDQWIGPGINSEDASLAFTMEEGLTIHAAFVINPFVTAVIGDYHGLALPDSGVPPSNSTHGAFQAKVTGTGSFTGALRIDNLKLPVAGVFNSAGVARFGPARTEALALPRPGKPSLLLALALDLDVDGTHQIAGAVTEQRRDGMQPLSVVTADRAWYDGKTPATSLTPATIIASIPAPPANPGHPSFPSSGQITVTKAGLCTFKGTLPDGTPFTASAPLSQAQNAAIFAPLYAPQAGSMGGWLKLNGALGNPNLIGENMFWFRPALSGSSFPFGWPEGVVWQVVKVP